MKRSGLKCNGATPATYVAYLFVHSLAMRSCSSLFCVYWVAIELTNGSEGLQSLSREQIESRTFEMERAGDHLSLRMSRQITPCELTLQW